MKLLVEKNFNSVNSVITEDSETKEKSMFIEGIFMQANIKNRNGRIYPESVLDKAVNKYITEYVNGNRALGELNHAECAAVNPERAAILIQSLRKEGMNYVGKAKVLKSTSVGQVVSGLMSEGVKLGISSRGLGSLEEQNGTNIVQSDFFLVTAGDVVHDPSAPEAFLNAVMEQREWVCVRGNWVPKHLEETKKTVKKTSQKNLEEMMLKEFRSFLKKL